MTGEDFPVRYVGLERLEKVWHYQKTDSGNPEKEEVVNIVMSSCLAHFLAFGGLVGAFLILRSAIKNRRQVGEFVSANLRMLIPSGVAVAAFALVITTANAMPNVQVVQCGTGKSVAAISYNHTQLLASVCPAALFKRA